MTNDLPADVEFVRHLLTEAYKVMAERVPHERGANAQYLQTVVNGINMVRTQLDDWAALQRPRELMPWQQRDAEKWGKR